MLQEYIATGKIGPIFLGTPKSEVQSILGAAEATSDRRKGRELWKYADLQVGFYQDLTNFIGVYVMDGSIKLPPPLIFDDQELARIMRLEDMKKFLLAGDLEFEVEDKLTFDDQTCLRIAGAAGAKIHLLFDSEELYSIQVTGPSY